LPSQPPLDLGQRIEEQIEGLETEDRRRHLLRFAALGAAGLAAVLLAFFVGLRVAPTENSPVANIPLEHVEVSEAKTGLAADADIVAHTWGVEVKLQATGFAAGQRYDVSVLSDDGRKHSAGEFVGTGEKRRCGAISTRVCCVTRQPASR